MFSIETIHNAILGIQNAFLSAFILDKLSIGFELEFYFSKKPSAELLKDIASIPFIVEIKSELGLNQYEITTEISHSLLEAADILYMVRHQINKKAEKYNETVFFNAVINEDQPPSSLQVNLCFYAKHTSMPLAQNNTSVIRILQNMVENIGSTMSIACPTEDCFKRISNYNFVKKFKNSPTHQTWGTDNRTVAIRVASIPNQNIGARIEYRTPSPLANPYHVVLALASSALCPSHLYHPQTFVDSIQSATKPLPSEYSQAVNIFVQSKLLKKIQHFCKKNAV